MHWSLGTWRLGERGEQVPDQGGPSESGWRVDLDPEGDEKALKNSGQGRGMAGSAFLRGHSVGWVGVDSGWSRRQRISESGI